MSDALDTDTTKTRQRRWQDANPLKRWAHIATASAIRRGILIRQPCRDCGKLEVDAHHPDHSNPLEVIWLCRQHHIAEHARLRRQEGGDDA